MNKLPKKIKIGGCWIDVEVKNHFDMPVNASMGESRSHKSTIKICGQMKLDKQWETFMHEICHEISGNNGLGLSESIVDAFANNLFQIFMDNKLLNICRR